MTKKIAAFILALCVALSLSTTFNTYADNGNISDQDYARQLMQIGVFKGTDRGFELDRAPTRLEGLIMLIRLLGKTEEANQATWQASGFNDVPEWARTTVNYARAVGLTNGISNTKFGASLVLSYQDYATFLLRALQFDAQSSWQTAPQDLIRLTNVESDDVPDGQFLRGDVARLSYIILLSKNSSGEQLLNKLVRENAIDKKAADAMIRLQLPDQPEISKDAQPIKQNSNDKTSQTVNKKSENTTTKKSDNDFFNKDTQTKSPQKNNSNSLEAKLFDLVNAERLKHDLQPLKHANAETTSYAAVRANEIGKKFSHIRPNGENSLSFFNNIECGENIASGFSTAEEVLAAWLKSPGHRANILNPDFHYIAIGVESKKWVQLFYKPAQ